METELKFELDAAGAKALGEHLQLSTLGEASRLRSVYYDTPETDLRDNGLSLRVRDDGKQRIQTVKQSDDGGGLRRGEWECELEARSSSDLSPDLDAAALTPLGRMLSRRELGFMRPAFEVDVKRITRSLEIDGAIIEIALDHGAARVEGRRSPIAELELELKAGSPKALFALAEQCSAVAPLELSFLSKAARGYALMEEAEPAAASAVDPKLDPDGEAGEAFRTIAGAALGQIAANARVVKTERLVEPLHQLRVGVRRLRTAISLFAPMLADGSMEGVKAELKWLAGELDDARDLDVFTEEVFLPFCKRDPELVGLDSLGQRLEAARARAYDRAQAAVAAPRFRALMLTTLSWIEAGDWALSVDPMLAALRARVTRDLAAEEFERRRRSIVKKGRDLATMEPAERHKLRIRVKRLRYACGFFAGLYSGKDAKAHKAMAATARDLQDGLGALTDIAFSRKLAVRVAGLNGEAMGGAPAEAAEAFAAGALIGQAAAPTDDLLDSAVKACRALGKADPFW